jgi:DNA-binding FadR family transcriptional regulator
MKKMTNADEKPSTGAKPRSRAKMAAHELRILSLSQPEGTFLGFEPDLIARLGVSRPTFRQAAKTVEHEQLVSITRGTRGGFYARRPAVSAVVHSAATYLMTRQTTLADLLVSTNALMVEAARLAAGCDDIGLREELWQMLADFRAGEQEEQTVRDFHKNEHEMLHLICNMSGNPSVDLLLKVLYDFGRIAFSSSIFEGREDLMQYRRSTRVRLLQAIADGDGDVAVLITRRSAEEMRPSMNVGILEQRMDVMNDLAKQPSH